MLADQFARNVWKSPRERPASSTRTASQLPAKAVKPSSTATRSSSLEQGRIAACHAFGLTLPPAPKFFPYGIYSVPEISTIGLSEAEATAQAIPHICGLAPLAQTSRGHIMGLDSGLLKLLFARDDHRLLGVHILGEGATELVHIGQAVINLGGGLEYFMENTFNYPTLAEAYKTAALDAWNQLQGD